MSNDQTLEDKLRRQRTEDGPARRKLSSLRGGYVELEKDHLGPTLIRICPMTEPTFWRRKSCTGLRSEWEFEQVEPPL